MAVTFTGRFAEELASFVAFKRTLGFAYQRPELTLKSFDRYVGERDEDRSAPLPLEELLTGFLGRFGARRPMTVSAEFTAVRQFLLHRRRSDSTAFVPDRKWLGLRATSDFVPHVLAEEQVCELLRATSPLGDSPFLGAAVRTLIIVLYCTGIRLGEGVRLQLPDVDLKRRTLSIAETKGRSRFVPFQDDLRAEIEDYLLLRRQIAAIDQTLFVRPDGSRFTVRWTSSIVRTLLRRIGLKPRSGREGPRPYDLRHSFAVGCLTRWYREGVDLQKHLPLLSAYMGHKDVMGTEVYLHATPELLDIAAQRFLDRFRRKV